MANQGVAPLDPTTDVGRFRLLFGDVTYVPLDPPQTGFGDYNYWSDDEIEGFIASGNGSVTSGLGWAYMSLSALAAQESKSVRDHDLTVDLTKRAGDLRATALMYFQQADDEAGAAGEAFMIVPTGVQSPGVWPEAATRTWC